MTSRSRCAGRTRRSHRPSGRRSSFGSGSRGRTGRRVFSAVADTAAAIRASIEPLHHPDSGPVTWWSSEQVRTWTHRPWNKDGKQLPLVHSAAVEFDVKFSDFSAMSTWVRTAADHAGATVSRIDWALTIRAARLAHGRRPQSRGRRGGHEGPGVRRRDRPGERAGAGDRRCRDARRRPPPDRTAGTGLRPCRQRRRRGCGPPVRSPGHRGDGRDRRPLRRQLTCASRPQRRELRRQSGRRDLEERHRFAQPAEPVLAEGHETHAAPGRRTDGLPRVRRRDDLAAVPERP